MPHCFNAHGFLLLGDIPGFSDLTYADIRNRVCTDGSEWLTPKVKEFLSSKLSETNEEYSTLKKIRIKAENLADKIFSVKNVYSNGVKHKKINFLGLKLGFKK